MCLIKSTPGSFAVVVDFLLFLAKAGQNFDKMNDFVVLITILIPTREPRAQSISSFCYRAHRLHTTCKRSAFKAFHHKIHPARGGTGINNRSAQVNVPEWSRSMNSRCRIALKHHTTPNCECVPSSPCAVDVCLHRHKTCHFYFILFFVLFHFVFYRQAGGQESIFR